jgi:hypothetical protein
MVPRIQTALQKVLKEGEALMKEIEAEVQERFWGTTAIGASNSTSTAPVPSS